MRRSSTTRAGRTVAAASTLEKDARGTTGANVAAAQRGRQAHRRARQGGRRDPRRVRSRRLPVPRPRQGAGRCRARRRAGVLMMADENNTEAPGRPKPRPASPPAVEAPRSAAEQRSPRAAPRPRRPWRRRRRRRRRPWRRRPWPAATTRPWRPRRRRRRRRGADREARPHQPRLQDREGRQALRLRRAGRGRRRQGPGRLRPRQGARSARGDHQGDRGGQEGDGPRAAARKAARCITTARAISAPAGSTSASAPAGTGIIAGGPMRAVFESLGVADVVTKSIGTSNPYNMIRATFEALQRPDSPEVGRAAPRQEDRRPARPRRRDRPRAPRPKPLAVTE